jgi:L-ascorbate metabolism protein UlaG (beta-lactamase superfamily)
MTSQRPSSSSTSSREPLELPDNSLFFVGNATVLIRMAGFTILTDPNFIHRHEKVGIGYGLTATRLTDPAIDIDQLPAVDAIVLSHFHGDHFDQVAEAELARDIPIVTTADAAEQLADRGFQDLRPLERWDRLSFERGGSRLTITATPGRHGPPVVSFALPDVIGTVLEFESAEGSTRLYISGDTLMYDDIAEIPERFPALDYGLIHLGGAQVLGVMVTMDADHGVRLVQTVNPGSVVPIHYDDYDVFKSPLADFVEACENAGLGSRLRIPQRGDTLRLRG